MTARGTYHQVLATALLLLALAGEFWRYLLSWWGWGALVLAAFAAVVVELARHRVRPWGALPASLGAFVLLGIASTAWSAYPAVTAVLSVVSALTVAAAMFLATMLSWAEILATLARAAKVLLAGSLLFELVVELAVPGRLLPFWTDYSDLDRIPNAFYWSRSLLFDGGRIQGLVGNSNLLAMIALLGLVAIVAQAFTRRYTVIGATAWVVVALGALALTRSATVLIAAVVAAVAVGILLLARRLSRVGRIVLGVGAAVAGGLVATAVLIRPDLALAVTGRSSDLTHRLDIWESVVGLALERPFAGWGWTGYWAPWVEPFDGLAVYGGVTYLQAHNAWLDVWLQLGVLGLAVFAVLAATTTWRVWTNGLRAGRGPELAGAAAAVAIVAALLTQSLAESRLLTESGWLLFATIAIVAARRSSASPVGGGPR